MNTPAFEVGTEQLMMKINSLSEITVPLHSVGIYSRKYCVDYSVPKLSENEVGCENSIRIISMYSILKSIDTPATSFFRNLLTIVHTNQYNNKTIQTKTMYTTVFEEGKRILVILIDAILIRLISPLPLLIAGKLSNKDKKCWLSYVFVEMNVGIDFLQINMGNFHFLVQFLMDNHATSFLLELALSKSFKTKTVNCSARYCSPVSYRCKLIPYFDRTGLACPMNGILN